MATYVPAALTLMTVGALGGGPQVWLYTSADAHGDVDAADFFSDGDKKGLTKNDAMCVIDTATATITWHRVSAVTAGGAATIGASAA